MTTNRDYYEILGVDKSADDKTIKQAYRKLAMKLHPDRNPDDPEAEEAFKEAAEAYKILSDKDKRRIYDQYGHAGLSGNAGFSGMEDIFSNFGDIFSDFFGGDIFGSARRSSRSPRPPRGADLKARLDITFEEAFKGAKKELELQQRKKCNTCEGTGAKPGTNPATCQTCQGHGQVVQRSGFMSMVTDCPDCSGRGSIITAPCQTCNGTGMEPYNRMVMVSVPAGVDSGMKLRLSGEGEKPAVGEPGDLYVFIEVAEHPVFVRKNYDLIHEANIAFTKAILGETLNLELVDETIEIKIPKGTQPFDVITVPQKGMPVVGRENTRGDLHVQVKVTLPTKMSKKQRGLIEQLDQLTN